MWAKSKIGNTMNSQKKYDVFISYRRKDTTDKAEHLCTLLELYCDGKVGFPKNKDSKVSFDKENLSGIFDIELIRRIDGCTDFVLILGKDSLNYDASAHASEEVEFYTSLAQASIADFEKKILECPNKKIDFFRIEIARALFRASQGDSDINIIVVSPHSEKGADGYNFSTLELPTDITHIKRYNAVLYNEHDDDFFREIAPKVCEKLKTPQSINADEILEGLSSRDNSYTLPEYVLPYKERFDIAFSVGEYDKAFQICAELAQSHGFLMEKELNDVIPKLKNIPIPSCMDIDYDWLILILSKKQYAIKKRTYGLNIDINKSLKLSTFDIRRVPYNMRIRLSEEKKIIKISKWYEYVCSTIGTAIVFFSLLMLLSKCYNLTFLDDAMAFIDPNLYHKNPNITPTELWINIVLTSVAIGCSINVIRIFLEFRKKVVVDIASAMIKKILSNRNDVETISL